MTPKTQAISAAFASAVTGYVAYFIALPPSLQTGIMGEIIALLPPQYQTAAAGLAKTAATFLGFYATYKAAHSGPQSPPANDPATDAPTVTPLSSAELDRQLAEAKANLIKTQHLKS